MTGETRFGNILNVAAPDGRTSRVYVKTRRVGDWQKDARKGSPHARPPEDERRFWLFVALDRQPTQFFIVPESWIESDIYEDSQRHLQRHGGKRPRNPNSTHHGISTKRVSEWQDRWDLLGLS